MSMVCAVSASLGRRCGITGRVAILLKNIMCVSLTPMVGGSSVVQWLELPTRCRAFLQPHGSNTLCNICYCQHSLVYTPSYHPSDSSLPYANSALIASPSCVTFTSIVRRFFCALAKCHTDFASLVRTIPRSAT